MRALARNDPARQLAAGRPRSSCSSRRRSSPTAISLSVLILILYFAYVGQAWNLMMGFAGQLSLGHALYVGLGALCGGGFWCISASARGSACSLAVAVAARGRRGDRLARLPLRYRGRLFRAAHHRLRRIHAHRLRPSRLAPAARPDCFLPVTTGASANGGTCAAGPSSFYYLALGRSRRPACSVAALLARARLGYHWLAIREDEAPRARSASTCSAPR